MEKKHRKKSEAAHRGKKTPLIHQEKKASKLLQNAKAWGESKERGTFFTVTLEQKGVY